MRDHASVDFFLTVLPPKTETVVFFILYCFVSLSGDHISLTLKKHCIVLFCLLQRRSYVSGLFPDGASAKTETVVFFILYCSVNLRGD